MPQHEILYLSRRDVESLGLTLAEIIEAVEEGLRAKASGRALMPPKHWLAADEQRFFSAMSAAVGGIGAGCKWQSGSALNSRLGLPYITGLMIYNDLESGLPLAIMDSTWLTAQRTAAATAVAARYLAADQPEVFAILGCGVQGRTNLAALKLVHPSIRRAQAFDISASAVQAYKEEMEACHGVVVETCESAEAAVRDADIVVTAGPIEPRGDRVIASDWLKPGCLGVTLDYDCYWRPGSLMAADGFYTDDRDQLEHLKLYGYFRDCPEPKGELGEVIVGKAPGRQRAEDVIVSVNMGVAVEDVAVAGRLYEAARRGKEGIKLSL